MADHELSLDIIEHGFLRKLSIKSLKGKLHTLFPRKLDKTFRTDEVD